MPFDDKKWNTPATQGDVAGVAIATSLSLYHLISAIETIKKGGDPSEAFDEIRSIADSLDKTFIEMTGWTKE